METEALIELIRANWWIVFVLAVWELIWKGWALWLAARRGEKGWFVALLVLNTFAILPIIYIFAVAKRRNTLSSE